MLTLRPNGDNANRIILKCCRPQGIPTMVMHSTHPQNRWLSSTRKPPNISHIKSSGRKRHPMAADDADSVDEPNGQRHRSPSRNVCHAHGIPIIVHASARLPVKYPTAHSKPPNTSQMILPRIFMIHYLDITIYSPLRPASTLYTRRP